MKQRSNRTLMGVAAALSSLLLISGCAGSAGSGGGKSGGGSGFEYGADQSEIDKALADLEPVTLKYQANAASQNSPLAADVQPFVDEIEKKSGGKITIDVVWGQAVAGWDEIDDALTDGRLDLAYTINGYKPSEYPGVSQLGNLTASFSKEPLIGDLIMNGALQEIAWSSPDYISDFEDKGLTLLLPAGLGGAYYSFCNSPGTSVEEWKGRQVRSANAAQEKLLKNIGANPVSLEYTETYEALQRNSIDCTVMASVAAVQDGIVEVAPYLTYSPSSGWAQAQGEYVAGTSFEQLPLAYQQIIFDAMATTHSAQMKSFIDPLVDAAKMAKENGGGFEAFNPELEASYEKSTEALRKDAEDSGIINTQGNEADFNAVVDKWAGVVKELGYKSGDVSKFDEWYDPKEIDLDPFGKRVFEETSLEHRPS